MAGLNTGDIVRCTFNGTLFNQKVMNVLHYRCYAPSTTDSYIDACLGVAGALYSGVVTPGLAMAACQAPQYNLDTIRVQKVNGSPGVYVESTINQPGTHADACTAPNIAATVTKRSETPGRRGLGSLHLPGVPATGYTGGNITAGYRLLLEAFSATLINPFVVPLETTGMQPVMWSKSLPLIYRLVIGTTVQGTIRVMRRRTIGVGR